MKRFQPKPHGAPRKDRTAAQERATDANFRIFKLRGLYKFACMLSDGRRQKMEALVDAELAALGAEPECARIAKRRLADIAEIAESDIPY